MVCKNTFCVKMVRTCSERYAIAQTVKCFETVCNWVRCFETVCNHGLASKRYAIR